MNKFNKIIPLLYRIKRRIGPTELLAITKRNNFTINDVNSMTLFPKSRVLKNLEENPATYGKSIRRFSIPRYPLFIDNLIKNIDPGTYKYDKDFNVMMWGEDPKSTSLLYEYIKAKNELPLLQEFIINHVTNPKEKAYDALDLERMFFRSVYDPKTKEILIGNESHNLQDIQAHEFAHHLDNIRRGWSDKSLTNEQLIEYGFDPELFTPEHLDYFTRHSGTELVARGSQVKNWLGFTNPKSKITPALLKRASKYYVASGGMDNDMSEFFKGIKDYKKAANYLSKVAPSLLIGSTTASYLNSKDN